MINLVKNTSSSCSKITEIDREILKTKIEIRMEKVEKVALKKLIDHLNSSISLQRKDSEPHIQSKIKSEVESFIESFHKNRSKFMEKLAGQLMEKLARQQWSRTEAGQPGERYIQELVERDLEPIAKPLSEKMRSRQEKIDLLVKRAKEFIDEAEKVMNNASLPPITCIDKVGQSKVNSQTSRLNLALTRFFKAILDFFRVITDLVPYFLINRRKEELRNFKNELKEIKEDNCKLQIESKGLEATSLFESEILKEHLQNRLQHVFEDSNFNKAENEFVLLEEDILKLTNELALNLTNKLAYKENMVFNQKNQLSASVKKVKRKDSTTEHKQREGAKKRRDDLSRLQPKNSHRRGKASSKSSRSHRGA